MDKNVIKQIILEFVPFPARDQTVGESCGSAAV